MAKQDTAPDETDEDQIWVKSPATGRKKQVSRRKLRILSLAGWTAVEEPKEDDPLIVAPFPSVATDDGERSPADQPEQNTRTSRRAAAEKEGS